MSKLRLGCRDEREAAAEAEADAEDRANAGAREARRAAAMSWRDSLPTDLGDVRLELELLARDPSLTSRGAPEVVDRDRVDAALAKRSASSS